VFTSERRKCGLRLDETRIVAAAKLGGVRYARNPGAKLLFVINSLAGGGAERVFSVLVDRMAARLGPDALEVVLLDAEARRYKLPEAVSVACLDARGAMSASMLGLAKMVAAKRPKLIVSFLTRANCAAIAAGRLSSVPCVISERVHTTRHFAAEGAISAGRMAVRLLYPRANAIIAVSEGVQGDLLERYGVARHKVSTIHNPVDGDAIRRLGSLAPDISTPHDYVVAVGRLTANKNFSLLIEAFARAKLAGSLVILGEGPERDRLAALADQMGLAGRFMLPGYLNNPYPIVARAKAFISSSNAEGFPNALIEAMSLGVPVIATDCESGPAEILGREGDATVTQVSDAAWGWLTPPNGLHEMTAAIRGLNDAEQCARYATLGRKRADHFSVDASIDQYQAIFDAHAPA